MAAHSCETTSNRSNIANRDVAVNPCGRLSETRLHSSSDNDIESFIFAAALDKQTEVTGPTATAMFQVSKGSKIFEFEGV